MDRYQMHLHFRRIKLSQCLQFRTPSANSLIRKYFEQVLQNRKKWMLNSAPFSIVAFVLDRKYKMDDALLDIS